MIPLSRRAAVTGLGSLGLAVAGCRPQPERAKAAPPKTIAQAVAGPWRSSEDKARDRWRHPAQSLAFWGLKGGDTVVEFWPGAGWYTEILAPFLEATDGKLYAAHLQLTDPADPAAQQVIEAYRAKYAAGRKPYGKVEITAFGPTSGPVAPAGTADLVLFLRNLHNWMAAGIAEKAFRDAFLALKPGGVLGVEEHRAAPGGAPDLLADTGYVDQAYAVRLGQEAGFRLAATSEINANPRDTRDHPFGVWTLPPVRRSSPRGEAFNPKFDHRRYDAIGESDRMTLKLVKPT
jgi:predicted methyltransferase